MARGLMQFVVGEERDWGEVPAALGMSVEQATGTLRGLWDGRVELRGLHTYEVRRHPQTHEESTRYYTELYAILDPPLRIGLRADSTSWLGRAWTAAAGASDLAVGHAELDRAYSIRAREEDVARRLLWGLADPLLEGARTQPSLWVSDRYVTIEHSGYLRDVEKCRAGLARVGAIAARLLDLRAHDRPSWEPAQQHAWSRIAEAWGLGGERDASYLRGTVRGAQIALRLSDDGMRTSVSIGLASALGCRLVLSRQNGSGFFARLFRGQDVQLGDPAFDEAFVVKGEPEARVRQVLHPGARTRLLAMLASYDGVKVENDAIELSIAERLSDAHAMDAMLKVCFAAAEALAPGPAAGEGPFRR